MEKNEIYEKLVRCSGPHIDYKTDIVDKLPYSSFHFDNFRYEKSQRNTLLRFDEFSIDDLTDKTIIDIGSNIGGMSFESLRRNAKKVTGYEYVQERVDVCNDLAEYLNLSDKGTFKHLDLNTILDDETKYQDFIEHNTADVVYCMAVDAYVNSKYKLYQLVYDITTQVCYFETNSLIQEDWFIDIMKTLGFIEVIPLGMSNSDEGHSRRSYILKKRPGLRRRTIPTTGLEKYSHWICKTEDSCIVEYCNLNQYLKVKNLVRRLEGNPYVIEMKFVDPLTIITPIHGKSIWELRESLTEEDKKIIKKQVIDFIKTLREAGLAHMDLHAKNVCYHDKQIKVIDWEYVEIETYSLKKKFDLTGEGPSLTSYAGAMKMNIFSKNKKSIKNVLLPIEFSMEDFTKK